MSEKTLAKSTKQTLVSKFAEKYAIEPEKLLIILKATAFKQRGKEVTNEQMAALLVVANQYGLNPFTKEIYAFDDGHGGIVPIVGVDGWARIINDHPQFDGVEFRESDELETYDKAKPCPKWIEAAIYRKDRNHPTVIREYLDETYQGPRGGHNGPWQTHTKRMLRHKTLIQCARIAFGFVGIYDEDEGERIVRSADMGTATVVVSSEQLEQLKALALQKGLSHDDLLANVQRIHNGAIEDLPEEHYQTLIDGLAKMVDAEPVVLPDADPEPAPEPAQPAEIGSVEDEADLQEAFGKPLAKGEKMIPAFELLKQKASDKGWTQGKLILEARKIDKTVTLPEQFSNDTILQLIAKLNELPDVAGA